MTDLSIACGLGPLTAALADPALRPPELDASVEFLPADALFARMLGAAPFDVAELSLANFMVGAAAGDDRFVGLPVFPFRSFRQSMLWVRADSGLDDPAQLRGCRVAIPAWGNTALVWLRGWLADDHGIRPTDVTWVRTGRDRLGFTPLPGLRLEDAPAGSGPLDLLAAGAVDAAAAFWAPGPPRPGLRRLLADPIGAEADWFRRTGIFPIMHLIVLRRDRYAAAPPLAASVARLFAAAKARHAADVARFGAAAIAVTPWSALDRERAEALLGPDPHPYGLESNRVALATLARYLQAQGLTAGTVEPDGLFAPEAVAALAGEGDHR